MNTMTVSLLEDNVNQQGATIWPVSKAGWTDRQGGGGRGRSSVQGSQCPRRLTRERTCHAKDKHKGGGRREGGGGWQEVTGLQ